MTDSPTPTPSRRRAALGILAGVLGWAVPGLGHLILGRWGRGLFFLFAVATSVAVGLALRGHVFAPTAKDPFELLGFLADLGTGAFYFLSRMVDNGGPDVSRAAGDFGTRFIAAGGLLNLLCALDASAIAGGKKQ